MVKVIILKAAGTNCDAETKFAFENAGAGAELVHINELLKGKKRLKDYQILAIPGGFTYGDDVASGKILANELKHKLPDEIKGFIAGGKLIIGICNGFQILVKAGILPGVEEGAIEATLTINDSGKFEDRWVYLRGTRECEAKRSLPEGDKGPSASPRGEQGTRCIWTKGIKEIIYLPVAHGEGKFVPKDENVLKELYENNHVVFEYVNQNGDKPSYPDNPNGSVDDIAGICDKTGRILGLMPHPERHVLGTQHPRWTREGLMDEGDGAAIFRNGVEYAKKI